MSRAEGADLLNHPLIAERYFFPGGPAPAPASRLDVAVDGAVLACGVHRVNPDGFTVVSMSISLIAVFVPILFMGGIVGDSFANSPSSWRRPFWCRWWSRSPPHP